MADDFGKELTLKEVAHALGRAPKTIKRWIEEGRFLPPTHLPGGKQTWYEKDIEIFHYLVKRGMFNPDGPPDVRLIEDDD